MDTKPNPINFINQPDINKMCEGLSRILSAKYNANVTYTATPKDADDKGEMKRKSHLISMTTTSLN